MGKASNKKDRSGRSDAAAQKRQADAAMKKREKLMRLGLGIGVGVVVVGIIAGAAIASSQSEGGISSPAAAEADPNAPLPKGALPPGDEFAYGVPVGSTVEADAPTLQVWEDFQCPACGLIERLNGRGIKDLGQSGRAKVILRPTTFLDGSLATDHSLRATAAWGCAIDQGKALEYHDVLFANQPEREGEGWTQDQLISFATQAGIADEGLAQFTTCVQEGTYRQWALNSTSIFYDNEIQGTPTGVINGTEEVRGQVLGDPVELEKALFGE